MFSIIAPIDTNRLKQFRETKRAYDAMPQRKEFLLPTRSADKVWEYLQTNNLLKDVKLLPYEFDKGFNPSMALNIGVRNAKCDNIVITSPEVKPSTDVLAQFEESLGTNIICEVADESEDKQKLTVLVTNGYRDETPAMYFLALFNKFDIEKINGWDEEFMKGYAYEDNDFGERWKRAGIPFEVRSDIKAIHQYHPRSETIRGGLATNKIQFDKNNDMGITKCEKGLYQKK